MKTQRGFIGLPILVLIMLGIVVLGGGAYFVMQQQSPSPSSDISIRIISPRDTDVYTAGDTIPVAWSIDGISGKDLTDYRVGIDLVPIDPAAKPAGNPKALIGRDLYRELIPAAVGTAQKKTSFDAGYIQEQTGGDANVRYKVRIYLAKKDESVCNNTSLQQKALAKFFNVARATTILKCNGYRTLTYADSDSTFIIRQPRLFGSTSFDNTAQAAFVTATVVLPNECMAYELEWSGEFRGREKENYEPSQTCSRSKEYRATHRISLDYLAVKETSARVVFSVQMPGRTYASGLPYFDTADIYSLEVPQRK